MGDGAVKEKRNLIWDVVPFSIKTVVLFYRQEKRDGTRNTFVNKTTELCFTLALKII